MVVLKRLELQGFKSFAGKTVINFDSSFTGIVGSNGCGKSNVADAVRWVLGEMSAKALRGNKMQDVIFKGTEKRPSMSYCEVTLVFDNSSRIFKTEREEISISRKLYRSTGTSEYYLNNNICRQRDILDIMRDTGAGKDGYSIIGQGRVAAIIDAKPIDRRQIFEEAAGIAKTKTEKIETERKLARAGEDIARLTDISGELEKQLAPLAKQKEAAQKFFDYKEEMRFQECNFYLFSRDNSVKRKKQITDLVASLTEELDLKGKEQDKITTERSECMAAVDGIEQSVRRLMLERENLKVSNEKNSGLMAVHKAKIDSLTADKNRLDEEIKDSESKKEELEQTMAEARAIQEIRQQEQYMVGEKVKTLNAKHFALSEEIVGDETYLEKNNSEVFDVFGRLSDVKSSLASFTAEAGSLSIRKEAMETDLASCHSIIEREDKQRQSSAEKIEKLKTDRRSISEKLSQSMYALATAKQTLYAKNAQLNSLSANYAGQEGRVRAMAEIVNQFDGYQQSVKLLLSDAAHNDELSSHIEGVVGQLIKVPKEYEIAIEAALGAAVQHIVTPTDDDAIYLVNYLKKNEYGVATMIPANKARPQALAREYLGVLDMPGAIGICSELISYDQRHYDVIAQLLGRTVIAETIEDAKDMANRYDYGVKIVTLDGDIIDPRRTITGGSRRQRNAQHLSKERELNEAREALKKLFIEKENFAAEVKKMDAEAKEMEENTYKMRDRIHQIDIDVASEESIIANSEKLLADTNDRLVKLQGEYDGVCKRLAALQTEIANAEGLNQDIEGKRQSAQGQAKQTKEDTELKRKIRDQIAASLAQAKMEQSTLSVELTQIETDIKRFQSELTVLSMSINEKKASFITVSANLEKEEHLAPELELSIAEKERIDAIGVEIQAKDEEKNALRSKIEAQDESLKQLAEQINAAMDKRAREESKVEKIDSDIETMHTRLLDDYEIDDAAIETLRDDERFNPSTANSTITSLRGKIAQLGSINFNAFDDYENVRTRYEEMSSQLSDLAKAKDDLEKLIADMSKDMLARFNVAFTQINQNFKKTFADLFGGGSAELVLVDTEGSDEMEKGVDISVKLPGKAHQNLSLLSGGEQTLTSIAILFAILRLRPMPFSMLDEIEAALDESNAILLANYLKKYSKNTQFIVITHKKPVMELADVLYGVTMEERGVSKVISVKLSDTATMEE